MLRPEASGRIRPAFRWLEPDRLADQVCRFPFITWPDVSVEERVCVSEDLEVHSAKLRIVRAAGSLNCFAERIDV